MRSPDGNERRQQHISDALGRDAREIRKCDVKPGGRGEKFCLTAEVMHDECRVDTGRRCDRTDGRAFKAVTAELRSRDVQDRRSGGLAITRSRGHTEQYIQRLLT